MDWSHFYHFVAAGIALLFAAVIWYQQICLPGMQSGQSGPLAIVFVLISAACFCFGVAERSYDLSQPITSITGTIDGLFTARHGTKVASIRVQTTEGQTMDFSVPGSSSWYQGGRVVAVSYRSSTHSVLSLQIFDRSGRRLDTIIGSDQRINPWQIVGFFMLAVALLVVAPKGNGVSWGSSRRAQIGDTFADNFTEDIPHWHPNETGDRIATDEEKQSLKDRYGSLYP